MSGNDLINGLFECTSGVLCIINILRLIKDKKLMGISWVPTAFFTLWGVWNLYYYPSLVQWISFCGGVIIFLANMVWLFLVGYYYWKSKTSNTC